MLPLLGYLSIPFFIPFHKLQNLMRVIHKGSIISNDWARKKRTRDGSLFLCGRGESPISQPQSAALKHLADAPRFAPNVRIADKLNLSD